MVAADSLHQQCDAMLLFYLIGDVYLTIIEVVSSVRINVLVNVL